MPRRREPAPTGFRPTVPLVWSAVVVTHALLLLLVEQWSRPRPPPPMTGAIAVEWLPVAPPPMVPPPIRENVATDVRPAPRAALAAPQVAPPTAEQAAVGQVAVADSPAVLFEADGSIRDLESQVRDLDERASARARFDYEIPGVAAAETAFSRPLAIDPQTTRFDRYWQAPPDLLTEALERAVKASTLVVSVPVPGMPGYRVGCAVVVIAATGGCGMTQPKRAVYDIDDPTTLSAEESRACEIIWERMTVATTQVEHRRLRRLYDLGCRLPLATGPAVEYR